MEIFNLSSNKLRKAVEFLRKGKVIVFPTDTVYGLIAEANNKKAVEKIFKIKLRQKEKWLPVFIKNINSAKKLAKIDKKQEKLLKSVWPGRTTVVLNRKKGTKLYGVDRDNIALRIPNYPLLNKLIEKINKPLVQTSANISGKKPINDAEELVKQFKKYKPDLIISAGKLKSNKSSRVIDITNPKIKIIRK